MPADIYTMNRTKDLIISFIKARGPSLPVHIARDVKISPLFASAFLSELYGEGKVKMSTLKIGSSSLYYLTDQEAQIENFINHMNTREKEAHAYLKQYKILDDEKLEPVIRVALRAIKDFAIPIKFTQNNQPRLFWRYFLVPEEEAQKIISAKLEPLQNKEVIAIMQPAQLQEMATSPPVSVPEAPRQKRKVHTPKPNAQTSIPTITLPLPEAIAKNQEKQTETQFPFTKLVDEHLIKREIKIIKIREETKKELSAHVSLATPLGQQNFFLIAKDKKRLKIEELIDALQKAHAEKMPALILAPGEIEKKAQSFLNEWSALLKFEKLV